MSVLHIIMDYSDVPEDVCLDDQRLLEMVVAAARAGNATIINTMRYRFGPGSPPGCTVIVMLDESHISIHTYADEGLMAIDVFCCGQKASAYRIADEIFKAIKPETVETKTLLRF